uniref:Uncharacterized protein n=1 Tax=Arundo donax TaxID=35708 RepID=A0A0A9H137_ARUDO
MGEHGHQSDPHDGQMGSSILCPCLGVGNGWDLYVLMFGAGIFFYMCESWFPTANFQRLDHNIKVISNS